MGGWLSFFCALAMIGLLTAIIGDLAATFGCLVGLKDSVTAITFVALGTSLPDLFASKQAAAMEKTADNSIGNVTGSNSVNVFLGLGLPWVIASIYWAIKVTIFLCVNATTLHAKRKGLASYSKGGIPYQCHPCATRVHQYGKCSFR